MSFLIRLYPACYNGDIQAINAGSPDVHINLQYKKWTEVQGKWLRTTMPTKHKHIKKNTKYWGSVYWLEPLLLETVGPGENPGRAKVGDNQCL